MPCTSGGFRNTMDPIIPSSNDFTSTPPHAKQASENKPTPEMIRPLPKVDPSKKKKITKRKPKKSEILTHTPVKNRIEKETKERLELKRKREENKLKRSQMGKKKKAIVKQLYQDSTTEDEEWAESPNSMSDLELESLEEEDDTSEIAVGNFVLVKDSGKKKDCLATT